MATIASLCVVIFRHNGAGDRSAKPPLIQSLLALSSVRRCLSGCAQAEFFVRYIQQFLPTWFVRFLVRTFLKLFVGWRMRSGDAVVQQILCDRKERTSKPVTEQVDVTNEQLYANDPAFFVGHLGPRLKYSACEWPAHAGATLAEAETLTIGIYQERLGLSALPCERNTLS